MTREEQRLLDSIRLVCQVKSLAGIRPVHAVTPEVAHGNYGRTHLTAMSLKGQGYLHVGRTLNYYHYTPTRHNNTMNEFEKTIKAHLDEVAKKDAAFAAKYTPDSKDKKKDISACCAYIISEVYKAAGKEIADDAIYGMAMHFYDEGLDAPKSVPSCKVVVTHHVEVRELSPEEEAKIREEARKEAEERIKQNEVNKLSREREKARKREENAQKRAMKKKSAEEDAKRKRMEEWEKADMLFSFDEEEA